MLLRNSKKESTYTGIRNSFRNDMRDIEDSHESDGCLETIIRITESDSNATTRHQHQTKKSLKAFAGL